MSSFIFYIFKRVLRAVKKLPLKVFGYLRKLRNDWEYERRVKLASDDPITYYNSNYFLKECGGREFIGTGEVPYKTRFAVSLLPEDIVGKRILDFGCGFGDLTYLLTAQKADAIGVDISPSAIEIGKKLHPNIDLRVIKSGELPDGCFDFIFLLDVVEHLKKEYAEKILKALSDKLLPGGQLIIHTNDKEQDDTPEIRRIHPEHISLFTDRQSAQLLTNCGLVVKLILKRHREEEGYSGGIWCAGKKRVTLDVKKSGARILISYQATFGDQLCLTPAINEYRRLHPNDYLAVQVTYPELYVNNPYVDEIVWTKTNTHFEKVYSIQLPVAPKYRKMTLQEASAKQIGLVLPEGKIAPQIFISETERKIWHNRFRRPKGTVVGFAPYSGWPSREWPVSRWRIVVNWLEQKCNASILYIGKGDRPYPWIGCNLAGLTNTRESALLLEDCDLLLSVDNGIAHMAAAVETPAVVLYGPLIGRYRKDASRIFPIQARDCIGCYHSEKWTEPPRECPLKHNKCMLDITPEMVIEASAKILGKSA